MEKLKIRSYGMLATIGTAGSAASWALTIQYIAQEFIKQGHELFLNTTNGIKGVPKALLKFFRDCPNPDIDIVYTLPQNYPHRFSGTLAGTKKAKLRLGIFNYESSILPPGWADYHTYVDYFLPSSEYVRDIFLRAGIPDEKIVVLPLGVDFDALNAPPDEGFKFNTNKKFKLLNISIPHARKNIPLLIDSYFEEFSADDDICLIVKTTIAGKKDHFEIDVKAAFEEIKTRHRNKSLPEIILLEHRFNNMATIYKETDALINVAASEGFGLPLLEAMACGKLVAAPRYGGVLDFLEHNKNSLLIDTVEVKAPPEYQYWQASPGATVGYPTKESIRATMRKLYENHHELHKKFDENMKRTVEKYTWENSAKMILDLYEGKKPEKALGELISDDVVNKKQLITLSDEKIRQLTELGKTFNMSFDYGFKPTSIVSFSDFVETDKNCDFEMYATYFCAFEFINELRSRCKNLKSKHNISGEIDFKKRTDGRRASILSEWIKIFDSVPGYLVLYVHDKRANMLLAKEKPNIKKILQTADAANIKAEQVLQWSKKMMPLIYASQFFDPSIPYCWHSDNDSLMQGSSLKLFEHNLVDIITRAHAFYNNIKYPGARFNLIGYSTPSFEEFRDILSISDLICGFLGRALKRDSNRLHFVDEQSRKSLDDLLLTKNLKIVVLKANQNLEYCLLELKNEND